MASEWKECTLSELGEIVGGATLSTKETRSVWYTSMPERKSTCRTTLTAV